MFYVFISLSHSNYYKYKLRHLLIKVRVNVCFSIQNGFWVFSRCGCSIYHGLIFHLCLDIRQIVVTDIDGCIFIVEFCNTFKGLGTNNKEHNKRQFIKLFQSLREKNMFLHTNVYGKLLSPINCT